MNLTESLKKRQLVTSALPYINAVKHLGNLVGSMLPADVYARFLRQTGHEVLFICATDDHGTPAEIAAKKAGEAPADFCKKLHKVQKEIYEGFKLSFDYFGHTSAPQNRELTQHLFAQLDKNGFTEERTIQQLYSPADERYLPDRYVEGTCPHCGYDKARGDQCENCSKVLDPTDLINPRSAISGSTDLEIRATKHIYLRQSVMADDIRKWINSRTEWSNLVRSIALKWLDEGLEDRCITRDLEWGVPVNKEGFEDKVFYVWFDAPIGYIGATKEWADESPSERDWKSWWYEADDVHYTEFMGKDNVPFHTVSFPATLIGSKEPWKMVDQIKGFSWLTYYGGKFSTSQGIGVFTEEALETLPSDYWRYYLMSRVPESDDSAFTWTDLQSVINKDLADVLGNYANRLLKFSVKKFGEVVPEGGEWGDKEQEVMKELSSLIETYTQQMLDMEYRKALHTLRTIWATGNVYLADAAPWDVFKTNPEQAAMILRTGMNILRVMAVLAVPVIPDSAEKLLKAVGRETDKNGWISTDMEVELANLKAGEAYTVPDVLFKKIEDEDVEAFEKKFGCYKSEAA